MLNHIVMWKIKEEVKDKEKVKLDIKNSLEGLFGKIKELREIRVETFMETTSTHDIALFVKVDAAIKMIKLTCFCIASINLNQMSSIIR